MPSRVAVIALFAVAAVRPAAGQGDIPIDVDDGAQAAYIALTATPVGAVSSWLVYQLGDAASRGTSIRAHFGNISEEGDFSRRTLAVGVDLALAGGTLGLTGGFHDFACDEDELGGIGGEDVEVECGGGFILGANWATPLLRSPLGTGGSTTFTLGLDATLGLGMGDILEISAGSLSAELEATSFSATAGVPLMLTARSGNVTFVPHLTPRLGFGHLSVDFDVPGLGSEDESESGLRAMLGGGLGILFESSGFGFDVGFQKVFVEDGNTLLGVGVRKLFR